jgi:hypothetical protein
MNKLEIAATIDIKCNIETKEIPPSVRNDIEWYLQKTVDKINKDLEAYKYVEMTAAHISLLSVKEKT